MDVKDIATYGTAVAVIEVRAAIKDAWPTSTGRVSGMQIPNGDYKQQVPK